MTTVQISAHRGTAPGDEKAYTLDPDVPLDAVRRTLTADHFLPPEAAARFRFVAARSVSSKLADALVDPAVESEVPLRSVLQSGRDLIATDVARLRNTDLIGIASRRYLVNRNLGVSIFLNDEDAEAKRTNDGIRAFKPLLLSKVHTTNPAIGGGWDHVCILVEGSVVGFEVKSWGAAGYTYAIAPDEGEPIMPDGLVGFGGAPTNYGTTTLLRYAHTARTIRIVGADSAGIGPDRTVRFQKVTVRSRRLTSYVENGKTFTNDQMPPPDDNPAVRLPSSTGSHPGIAAAARSVGAAVQGIAPVPGDSIKPGGPVPGVPSAQQFAGPKTEAVADDWSQALGELAIFFFVFKDWDQARQVVTGYNTYQQK